MYLFFELIEEYEKYELSINVDKAKYLKVGDKIVVDLKVGQ